MLLSTPSPLPKLPNATKASYPEKTYFVLCPFAGTSNNVITLAKALIPSVYTLSLNGMHSALRGVIAESSYNSIGSENGASKTYTRKETELFPGQLSHWVLISSLGTVLAQEAIYLK